MPWTNRSSSSQSRHRVQLQPHWMPICFIYIRYTLVNGALIYKTCFQKERVKCHSTISFASSSATYALHNQRSFSPFRAMRLRVRRSALVCRTLMWQTWRGEWQRVVRLSTNRSLCSHFSAWHVGYRIRWLDDPRHSPKPLACYQRRTK